MNPPATPGTYPYPNKPTWSRSEKGIARKVFDAALGNVESVRKSCAA